MNWQPIDTAPKDGTDIVVVGTLIKRPTDDPTTTTYWTNRPRACISRWVPEGDWHYGFKGPCWTYSAPGYSDHIEPEWWTPLPDGVPQEPSDPNGKRNQQ